MTKRSTSTAAKKAAADAKTAETTEAAAAAVEVKETENEVAEMEAKADKLDAPEPATGEPVPFDEEAPAESLAQSEAQEAVQEGGDAHLIHADDETSHEGRTVGATPHAAEYATQADGSTKGQPVGGNSNTLGADPADDASTQGQQVGGNGNVRVDELEKPYSAAGQPIGGNVNIRVPATGALEAPEAPAVTEDGPTGVLPVASGEVGVESASEKPHDALVNALTNEAPDPDLMFEDYDGPGNLAVCRYRLAQVKNPGEGWSSTKLLVMPAGQIVSKDRAEQLVALVRAQTGADSE